MKIELFYLLKVVLHLDTFKDVIEFCCINKKCTEVFYTLHVNPWFIDKSSIISYAKHFKPTTMNCCENYFTKKEIPKTIKFIKNVQLIPQTYILPGAFNQDTDSLKNEFLKEVLPMNKITKCCVSSKNDGDISRLVSFFKHKQNDLTQLTTIETEFEFIYKLFFSDGLYFSIIPKKLIITLHNHYDISNQLQSLVNKFNTFPDYTKIVFLVKSAISKDITSILNTSKMKLYVLEYTTDDSNQNIICNGGKNYIEYHRGMNLNNLNENIKKCYAVTCNVSSWNCLRRFNENEINIIHWNTCSCIKQLNVEYMDEFKCDLSHVKELVLKFVKDISIPTNSKLKTLHIDDSTPLFVKKHNNEKHHKKRDFPRLKDFIFSQPNTYTYRTDELIDLYFKTHHMKKLVIKSNKNPLKLIINAVDELCLMDVKNTDISIKHTVKNFTMTNCTNVKVFGKCIEVNDGLFLHIYYCNVSTLKCSTVIINQCKSSTFVINQFKQLKCINCFSSILTIENINSINESQYVEMKDCCSTSIKGDTNLIKHVNFFNCMTCFIPINNILDTFTISDNNFGKINNKIKTKQLTILNEIKQFPIHCNTVETLILAQLHDKNFMKEFHEISCLKIINCERINIFVSSLNTLYVDDSDSITLNGKFKHLKELSLINCSDCKFPSCNKIKTIHCLNLQNVIIGNKQPIITKQLISHYHDLTNKIFDIQFNRNVQLEHIINSTMKSNEISLKELTIISSNTLKFDIPICLLTKLEVLDTEELNESLPHLLHLKIDNSVVNLRNIYNLTYLETDGNSCNESEVPLDNLKNLVLNNTRNTSFDTPSLTHLSMNKCSYVTFNSLMPLNEIHLNCCLNINLLDSMKLEVNETIDCFNINYNTYENQKASKN